MVIEEQLSLKYKNKYGKKIADIVIEVYIPIDQRPVYISLSDRLNKKYNREPEISTAEPVQESSSESAENLSDEKNVLRFTDDPEYNLNVLNNICDKAKKLKKKYIGILGELGKDDVVYLKTADKLIILLERFIGKGKYNPDKTSDELIRMLKTTILKNYANVRLVSVIDDFFAECDFMKIEIPVGKILEEEDFEFIGEDNLVVDVDSPHKHNMIIEKRHDAYIFDCYDADDEDFIEKIIPGSYTIGRWKE